MTNFFNSVLIFGLLTGCMRLDDGFYKNVEVKQYKWDLYEGEVDFKLSSAYYIQPFLINEIVLDSKAGNEKESVAIAALYVGSVSTINMDTVILYCHGNKGHMDFYWPRVKLLANAGGKNRFGVMTLDYRGYGKSKGEPTEKGMYADVKAAINWLAIKGLTSNRLIIYGYGLGSAPAVFHAAKSVSANLLPSKLILENPVASASAVVQDAAGLVIPGQFVTNLTLNNTQQIKVVLQPLQMWLSGEDRFLKKESHGEVIYKNHTGFIKEKIVVGRAGHNELINFYSDWKYVQKVANFIASP